MATLRERPYVQFNFLVDIGTGSTDGPEAGFQEVSGMGMEVTVSEYRPGNHRENSVMKITGMKMAKMAIEAASAAEVISRAPTSEAWTLDIPSSA